MCIFREKNIVFTESSKNNVNITHHLHLFFFLSLGAIFMLRKEQ